MGSYSWLTVGPDEVVVGSSAQGYSLEFAALFVDNEDTGGGYYASTVGIVRRRIELLGHDASDATTVITDRWSQRLYISAEDGSSMSVEEMAGDAYYAADPDDLVKEYVASAGTPPAEAWDMHNYAAKRLQNQWGYIWAEERNQLRFLLDRLPDNYPVAMDITDVVARDHVTLVPTLCADARREQFEGSRGTMPTIILTEGSTDAEFLEQSLDLIRPEYSGFLTFMNYGLRPDGGVVSAVNGLKAFAAAGVGNRVIGLVDNDTAARDGIKALESISLPPHMKVVLLPNRDWAESYPAHGPDGLVSTDINGRAVSIELFLGRDILTSPDGMLIPVQWTAYKERLNSYHGEIMKKAEIQTAFRAKLRSASAAGQDVRESSDWQDMGELLDYIVAS